MSLDKELLEPTTIYREIDSKELFGLSLKHLKEKIANGDIPKPHLLSAPPSRARGWYGYVINEYRENVAKQQEAWAAENAKHQPKGGDVRKTNPPAKPKPAVVKVKGLKRPCAYRATVGEGVMPVRASGDDSRTMEE
jgi:hypothetical protein